MERVATYDISGNFKSRPYKERCNQVGDHCLSSSNHGVQLICADDLPSKALPNLPLRNGRVSRRLYCFLVASVQKGVFVWE
jgi:hypothetical protein